MPDEDLEAVLSTVRDNHLRDTLNFGIGMHHAGLHERDRKVRLCRMLPWWCRTADLQSLYPAPPAANLSPRILLLLLSKIALSRLSRSCS